MTAGIVWEFFKSFCVLFFIAFIFSKLDIIKNHLTNPPTRMDDKLVMALLFGALGCVGSSIGVEFYNSLINTRVIGVAVGGLLGGPLVGVLSGLIAAGHRIFLVKAGSATAVVCGISMIIEGAFAGYFSRYLYKFRSRWFPAAIVVILCELFRKLMLLLFIRPQEFAVLLVKNMTVPMLVINTLGVILFVKYIETVVRESDLLKIQQSDVVLALTEKISTCLKQGLIGENLQNVVRTIEENTDFTHIFITNTSAPIISNLSAEKNADFDFSIAELRNSLDVNDPYFEFAIGEINFLAAPIYDESQVAGFLMLGKKEDLNTYDIYLAGGLGKLFSTQLAMGNLEYRSSLLKEAEIKVLQTQINPHFLFNSLTVISSLCRTDPMKARSIIDHLAEFYRKNLRVNSQMVTLEEELSHIEAYLEIIRARYASKIDITFDVDEVSECYIPPLSLQPLVENCVKHGLLPKRDGGVITVRAKREPSLEAVKIEVEDNGVGFDLTKPPSKDSNRIGLSNVKERLVNCFGDDLLWRIDTQPDVGTKVTLVIPIVSR